MERRLAAILAADVAGYSRLMERDEERTHAAFRLCRGAIAKIVADHRGRIFGGAGDSVMVEFSSPVEAVRAGMEIQNWIAEYPLDLPEDLQMQFRIGINLGDVIVENDDIYGDGVNIAARLQAMAAPGGICLSGTAFEHAQGKVDAAFEDMGEHQVKNIARPIHVWRWGSIESTTQRGRDQLPTRLEIGRPSLAVLPIINMSDKREYEYLADGLTEDITTLLARIPGFLVVSRTSAFVFKGKAPHVRDVARELGVRYVVEGSLRPIGDQLRITIQLIDAESGNHVWAGRFDHRAEDIQVLQDEITLGIAARLEPELAKSEIEKIKRRPPSNLDAWSYYQRASGLLSIKGWHRETFEEAVRLLNDAIALDPNFALAHAYLSLLLAVGHVFGLAPLGSDPEHRAIEEAEQAMDIDSQDAAVLGFSGCALCDLGQLGRGIAILERAVDADPSNAQAWVAMGTALIQAGKARKGVDMLQHGMRISPLDNRLAYWGTILANALFRLRRVEQAEREARLACKRDDRLYMAKVVLAIILAEQGRVKEAKREIAEALRVRPMLSAQDVRSLVGRHGLQILEKNSLLA
jgi:adenylate cyclase